MEPLQHADEAMMGPPDFMCGNAFLLRVGLASVVGQRWVGGVIGAVGLFVSGVREWIPSVTHSSPPSQAKSYHH